MVHLLQRVGGLRVCGEPMDAWLSKWGSWLGAAILFAVSVAGFSSHASTRDQWLLGLAAMGAACCNLLLFGVLSARVHLACHRGAVPWRIRGGELLALAAGVAVMAAGAWCVLAIGLTLVAMSIGALLTLAIALAIISLGLCSTLKQAA